MGETLHNSKMGTTIGKDIQHNRQGINISAMFFADDLILIADTKSKLEKLIKILNNECKKIKMEISLSK